jgi:hypothetical protein
LTRTSRSPPTATLGSPHKQAVKSYVDNSIAGLKFKVDVRVASTANVSISSAPSSIDGVTLTSGDRVLLKNQTTASQNGAYIFNGAGSAMTRATDADTGAELISATFPVREGTANQDTWWTVTNDTITLGSTSIVFTQTAGAGTYTAGSGLTLSGNQFSIAAGAITNAMLAGSIDLTTKVTGQLPIANGGTGQATASAAFDALSPNTTLGDMSYRGPSSNTRLAGNTSSTKKFLTQTGNGSVSAAPAWGTISQADVSGLTTSDSPTFAGATFTGNVLLNAATANLFLKDTSTGWRSATTLIITPQANNSIRSTNYSTGLTGWNISANDTIEANNVDIRGAIHASVIVYNAVQATAGTQGVFKAAAKLRSDVTIPASPTYISAAFNIDVVDPDGLSHASSQVFAVGDVIRLKDGTNSTWFIVASASDQTTFWRYACSLYAGSNNVTYRAGAAVADYGASGNGFIIQTADQANSPYLQMATHSATFSSNDASGTLNITPQLRLGNLNGSYDYSSNVYGFGAGQYAVSKSWITVEQTNGLRIGNNTTVLGQWDTSGSVQIGDASGSNGNVKITAAGQIQIRRGTTNYITLDATDAQFTNKIKMSGSNAAISIGSTPPTDATHGTGIWLDRTGMYGLAADVQQAIFDATTGKITAGAGNVVLDSSGLAITVGTVFANPSSFKNLNGSGTTVSQFYGYYDSSIFTNYATVEVPAVTGTRYATLNLSAAADLTTGQVDVLITAKSNSIVRASVSADSVSGILTFFDASSSSTLTSSMTIDTEYSAGAAAAGFGGGILFKMPSTTTSALSAAQIGTIWTTATHASRTSAFVIQTVNNAGSLTEVARFAGNGDFTLTGVIKAGSGPTTLTDSAGKILSAALNTVAIGQGGTNKTSWTAGSIPYLTSTTAFAEDNTHLYYDATNIRFGVGTNSLTHRFQIAAAVNDDTKSMGILAPGAASGDFVGFVFGESLVSYKCAIFRYYNGAGTAANSKLCLFNGGDNAGTAGITILGGGNVGIKNGSPAYALDVTGDVNVTGDVRKGGTAYTNPDYVLEHWATGKIEKFADKEGASDYQGLMPLGAVREFAQTNLHLPRFGQKAGHGLFSGGDAVLATLEEAYLYIFQLEERVKQLEGKTYEN